jgi:hypothetical protein
LGVLDTPAVGKHLKTAGTDLLPINHGILWCPDASQATPGVFDDLDLPARRRLDPLDEAAFGVPALGPDPLEPREAAPARSEQPFAAVLLLETGLLDEDRQDQPGGVNEHMALAACALLN